MDRELQKTEITDYSKDEGNRALLNTNSSALQAYKQKKARNTRIDFMEDQINTLTDDMKEIKALLKEIIHG